VSAPIRLRLTAWYVLLLAAVLTALGAFVVTQLRSDLLAGTDSSLSGAASQIAQGWEAEGAKDFLDVAHTVLPGPIRHGSGAQVIEPTGPVVVSVGDPLMEAPLITGRSLGRVVSGRVLRFSIKGGAPREHLRAVAVPVRRHGRGQALVVTESLAAADHAAHRVLVLGLLGGAGALALIALGGWWIARRALAPVERMTSRADRIGIEDLGERIPVPRWRDEVGHLARTLNAMLARLELGMQARERLIADVSHELRAPLAAIRSELEVSLRHDALEGDAREAVASAREETVRMSRIVENLLTLARIDEGGLELLVASHDLGEVAEEAAASYRSAAESAGVRLTVTGGPASVQGDRDRLRQVIGNLIDNAISFSPAGSEVAVQVWSGDAEVGIRVADAGPGVPHEDRERIFERFARRDPARSREGGAGLGLAIARQIVASHQGRIWVQEREPRGSVFVVALPAGDPPPPDAARRGRDTATGARAPAPR
jgi:two-component system OmpR family sensor kinase